MSFVFLSDSGQSEGTGSREAAHISDTPSAGPGGDKHQTGGTCHAHYMGG